MINLIKPLISIACVYMAGAEGTINEVGSVGQRTIVNGEITEWNNPYIPDMQCEVTALDANKKCLPSGLNYADCLEAKSSDLVRKPFRYFLMQTDDCNQKMPTEDPQLSESNPRQSDESLCEIATPYINNHWWKGKGLWRLQKPSNGHTPVYLHDSLVIKEPDLTGGSGFFTASTMKKTRSNYARNICEKYGYQLEIPTSCQIYHPTSNKEYFVERRYPISTRKAAALAYDQNPAAFTERVKDFTGFLMQVYIGDLMAIAPIQPRYDNIVPYLEQTDEGPIGKIVLVDLDHLNLNRKCEDPVMACMIAISFFPHHYDEILDVAKQFFPNIENYRNTLEQYEKSLKDQGLSSTSNYITLESFRDDALRDRKRDDILEDVHPV